MFTEKKDQETTPPSSEIGSEFWLNSLPNSVNNDKSDWLSNFGDYVFTSSGRGAITLLLEQIDPKNKTVLLPAYICNSVILPFLSKGYNCYYYEVNNDLSPNIDSINSFSNIGVFLHMGYFGFQTNSNLFNIIRELRHQSTIVIEDITHTLFSSFYRFEDNDFYVGSIRKWFGLPSGGLLGSSNIKIKGPHLISETFSKLRTEALLNKGKYMKSNDSCCKELFLKQFSEAETLLDQDLLPYCIDSISMDLINSLDSNELKRKRRENFNEISNGLRDLHNFDPLFHDIKEEICPMFFPVLIKKNRDTMRKRLTEAKIYCPVHWPVPVQIEEKNLEGTLEIYNCILSIPCDQRFGINETSRIIEVLRNF
jgi:hypothetical protein